MIAASAGIEPPVGVGLRRFLARLEEHEVPFSRPRRVEGHEGGARVLAVLVHGLHQEELQAVEAFHLLRADHPADHSSQLHQTILK